MVSNIKRMRNVSDELSTSEDSCSESSEYPTDKTRKTSTRKPTRTPKCFTRNAQMARENRLKKKLYIESLENQTSQLQKDNSKLNTILENQSGLIRDLRKEVKYLKSVLANSKDIGNLIRNINSSTGMSVTTSLRDKSLNSCFTQKPIARKVPHPWHKEENQTVTTNFYSFPTSESSMVFSSPDHDFLDDILLNNDVDFNDKLFDTELFDVTKNINTPSVNLEHNYTAQDSEDKDIGGGSDLNIVKKGAYRILLLCRIQSWILVHVMAAQEATLRKSIN